MEIDIKGCKKVGVKLSGGADSAIMLYLLCKNIIEKNLDIEYIIPITTQNFQKPFNFEFSGKILEWMKKEFPSIPFIEQHKTVCIGAEDYVPLQTENLLELSSTSVVDCVLGGITLLPQDNLFESSQQGPTDDRSPEAMKDRLAIKFFIANRLEPKKVNGIWCFNPLGLLDKKGIAKLYKDNNLMDSLFPITRSCEWERAEDTNNFTTHCGMCWFCHEREWAFGRLE